MSTENKYKVVNGTSYHVQTIDKVINILESARRFGTRLVIDCGDVETGKSWNETFDTTGYIGRSYGGIHNVPLLLYNSRSMGGGAILDHCIVKIMESKGKRVLYQHPTYSK